MLRNEQFSFNSIGQIAKYLKKMFKKISIIVF